MAWGIWTGVLSGSPARHRGSRPEAAISAEFRNVERTVRLTRHPDPSGPPTIGAGGAESGCGRAPGARSPRATARGATAAPAPGTPAPGRSRAALPAPPPAPGAGQHGARAGHREAHRRGQPLQRIALRRDPGQALLHRPAPPRHRAPPPPPSLTSGSRPRPPREAPGGVHLRLPGWSLLGADPALRAPPPLDRELPRRRRAASEAGAGRLRRPGRRTSARHTLAGPGRAALRPRALRGLRRRGRRLPPDARRDPGRALHRPDAVAGERLRGGAGSVDRPLHRPVAARRRTGVGRVRAPAPGVISARPASGPLAAALARLAAQRVAVVRDEGPPWAAPRDGSAPFYSADPGKAAAASTTRPTSSGRIRPSPARSSAARRTASE